MTRSVIPVLKEAGVEAITVGVNTASTPPNVSPGFHTVASSIVLTSTFL